MCVGGGGGGCLFLCVSFCFVLLFVSRFCTCREHPACFPRNVKSTPEWLSYGSHSASGTIDPAASEGDWRCVAVNRPSYAGRKHLR